jgi:transcriptional regulator with XRE-family HTH domain
LRQKAALWYNRREALQEAKMSEVDALVLRRKILGVLLQGARMKSGRTKQECANVLGAQPSLITAYEEGRKDISLPELELLAYFLGVPLVQFWGNGEVVIEPASSPPPDQLIALRQRIIAVLLREARTRAGKTLKDIAAVLGCSARRVGEYERGERSIPLTHLEVMSEHLGASMSYFLDEGIGTVGERELNDRLYESFLTMPEDMRKFVVQPINEIYLRVAMRLAEMPASQLRGIAEGLLEITY